MRAAFLILFLSLTLFSGCTTTGAPKKSGDDPAPREPFHHMGRLGL